MGVSGLESSTDQFLKMWKTKDVWTVLSNSGHENWPDHTPGINRDSLRMRISQTWNLTQTCIITRAFLPLRFPVRPYCARSCMKHFQMHQCCWHNSKSSSYFSAFHLARGTVVFLFTHLCELQKSAKVRIQKTQLLPHTPQFPQPTISTEQGEAFLEQHLDSFIGFIKYRYSPC